MFCRNTPHVCVGWMTCLRPRRATKQTWLLHWDLTLRLSYCTAAKPYPVEYSAAPCRCQKETKG